VAEVIRYVDPDATGSGTGVDWTNAYTSLSAWEAAEQTNLVTDGDWHHVYCRSSSGTADTTGFVLAGWTTDSTHNIVVEAADGDQAVKTGWDTSRYRLVGVDDRIADIQEDYVTFRGLQFGFAYTSAGYEDIMRVRNQGVSNEILIDSCYFRTSSAGTTNQQIYAMTTNVNLIVVNTVMINGRMGVRVATDCSITLYNNVIYNCTSMGVYGNDTGATLYAKNNAVFDTPDDFDFAGTATIDHCASDDGDGTNSVAPSGSDWDNEYSDPANGDFTLLNTGNCYHGGATGPDTGLYTTDMEGDTYNTSAYSIGVDEYAASGGIVIPTVISLIRRLIG